MRALSFDALILGGAASRVPHEIFNYFFGQRCHCHQFGDRHPYSFVGSLSPYGLVFFVCAFDAVFELAPVVEKLLDHFAGAAGLTGRKVTISPTWNVCGAGSPCSAVQRVHLGATLRHAGWRPQI
jgi:hypothetical protein